MSKAQMTADGKVTPAAGTQEAFEKYLPLKPDGPNAESAKGMLASHDGHGGHAVQEGGRRPPSTKKGKKK